MLASRIDHATTPNGYDWSFEAWDDIGLSLSQISKKLYSSLGLLDKIYSQSLSISALKSIHTCSSGTAIKTVLGVPSISAYLLIIGQAPNPKAILCPNSALLRMSVDVFK